MRLTAREVSATVTTHPDSGRPIRLRCGSIGFAMEVPEALDLATQLADAVTQLKKQEDQR